jgi:integrase
MQWDHIDCDTGVWTVPEAPVGISEGYMKSGRQFSTKLPTALLESVCSLPRACDFVFSVDDRKPINAETLRRNFQKFADITTHGFRNTFKTWCLNNDVDEFLADRYCDHALKGLDKNYRRDDLFEPRATLAERYFNFVRGF